MIRIINSQKRHFSDFGWLKTYWLFSFANYFDPDNIQFGALRVFNDDIVEPGTGFPTHPHREMEIITIVLSGEITHRDSMDNKNVIRAGEVQRMSAGTGITHSEFNLADEPVNFYQVWILPDKSGLKPSYDQKSFKIDQFKNELFPIASGEGKKGAVTFNTSATIYRAIFDKDFSTTIKPGDNRRIYIYLTSGKLAINDEIIVPKDQARIDLEEEILIRAGVKSDFILIDIPSCKGWGYDRDTLKGAKKSSMQKRI